MKNYQKLFSQCEVSDCHVLYCVQCLKCARNMIIVCFVCLGFIVPLENVHSYEDVTSISEGLQFLTYARHLWSLRSEGFLTCRSHCDNGLLFIKVISEQPVTPTPYAERLAVELLLPFFTT